MAGPDQPPKNPRSLIGLMVIGSEMAGFTVVGVLIDWAAGTMPAFTIGLTLLGVAVAFLHLIQLAKQLAKPKGDGGSA